MESSLIVYRRNGCPYCRRLEHALAEAEVSYDRRDIWQDPEAAAFVRSVNDGNETVPTVVLPDGQVHTNPRPRALLDMLGVGKQPGRLHQWLKAHRPG